MKTLGDFTASMLEEKFQWFYEWNPFVKFVQMEFVQESENELHLELEIKEEHTNPYGIAHGGVLMSVADTAMGAACLMENKKVVTLNLSMSFLHAAPMGRRIHSVTRVLHNGGRTMACEVELHDEQGKLLTKAQASFFVLGNFFEDEERGEER